MMVKLEFVMIAGWCACQAAEGELVEQWDSRMELECRIGTALFLSKQGDFEKIIIANLTATSVHGGWGENGRCWNGNGGM